MGIFEAIRNRLKVKSNSPSRYGVAAPVSAVELRMFD